MSRSADPREIRYEQEAVAGPAAGRPRLRAVRAAADAYRGATPEEAAAVLPGDDLIPDGDQSTMAATLMATPEEVWPWLVQMGRDREGWYSWDRLDNGGRPSADHIEPRWQDLKPGDRIDALPDGKAYFTVEVLEEPHTLVLSSELAFRRPGLPEGFLPVFASASIWAFHLTALHGGRTRLVVRSRGTGTPRALARLADLVLGQPAHFIMQLHQFHNLAVRVAPEGWE